MGFFDFLKPDKMFGTDPKIMSKEFWYPLKRDVASPLSRYLSSQVGKGIGDYGGKITEDMDPEAFTGMYLSIHTSLLVLTTNKSIIFPLLVVDALSYILIVALEVAPATIEIP